MRPPKLLVSIALIVNMALAQLPVGSECEMDSECETDICSSGFLPVGTPGSCICNVDTNEGCNDGEECGLPMGLLDGIPLCMEAIPCTQDSDCTTTNRCFFTGLIDQDNPTGTCRCNSDSNAGCTLPDYFCSDNDIAFDGFPRCVLPVGASCQSNRDCETSLCFSNFLVNDPVCVCDAVVDFGCGSGETCTKNPDFSDVPPACVEKSTAAPTASMVPTVEERTPLGGECFQDSECETNRCFFGFQPPDQPGRCACHVETNAGCEDAEVCTDFQLAFDGPPICTVCGEPMEPCFMENYQDCRNLELGGCPEIAVLESCPVQYACETLPPTMTPIPSSNTEPITRAPSTTPLPSSSTPPTALPTTPLPTLVPTSTLVPSASLAPTGTTPRGGLGMVLSLLLCAWVWV